MDIHQEKPEIHTIEAYSDSAVRINQKHYDQSLIVSADLILPAWHVDKSRALTEQELEPLLSLHPEVILIGSVTPVQIDIALRTRLGLECMSLGAASRTFNILLSESRRVVLGLIF